MSQRVLNHMLISSTKIPGCVKKSIVLYYIILQYSSVIAPPFGTLLILTSLGFFSSWTTMSDLVPHLNRNAMPAGAGLENALWFVLALLFWGIHLVALPAPYSVHCLIENVCALFSSTYRYYIMVAKFFFPHLFFGGDYYYYYYYKTNPLY